MFAIFTDSDADMPLDLIEKYDVGVVPFGISYGDEVFHRDFYELGSKQFFTKCREADVWPRTSQPTFADYEERFRPVLEQGHDIFCLCISQKFSGSYQSGHLAMTSLAEEFPDRKIVVMDSRRCTVLHGYLVYQACLMRESGMGFDAVSAAIEGIRDDHFVYITVDSLEYLRKGGRLGKASALAGSLLGIKPIITMGDGELQPHSKVRGKKNAMTTIISSIDKAISDRSKYTAIPMTTDMPAENVELSAALARMGFTPPPGHWTIGPVVGAHLGPTGFGVVALKKYEGQRD